MNDPTIRRVLIFFLFISAVLIGVAVAAVKNISRSVATSDWVNHTHAVILESEALRSSLQAGDGAMRTYVLTGEARDQAAARGAFADVAEHLEVAKALTRQEPAQSQQRAEIESLSSRRIAFGREVLAARQDGGVDGARTLLIADAGGEAVREIMRKLDRLKSDEMALLAERDTASYLQAQTTRWVVWLGVALDVLLLGGAGWLIRDDLATRRRLAAALQETNEQLEIKVQARTAELAKANTELSSENLERQWANQALEHQLRYNELIINSITDLVFVVTKAMNVTRVNPAVILLTGLEAAKMINQPLSRVARLVGAGGDAPMLDPIIQALKNGRDLRDQPALVEDVRGHLTPVRFTLFPLRDKDKVVGGVVTLQISPPAAKP
ncbi:MAG: PAS domain-containing protein [Opitutus sp.]|nr:PAS domain-containing protein [Opitutus sp.]